MILDTIAAAARRRVEERKRIKPMALVMAVSYTHLTLPTKA